MIKLLNIDVCIPTLTRVPDQIIDSVKKETRGEIHVSRAKPLVKARVELIDKVETTLFLFLDDDIIYPPKLLTHLYGAMMGEELPDDVGAVQGQTIPYGLGDKWDRALGEAVKFDGFKVMRYGQRLMSSNMLMFTHLVKDWKPVKDVSGCEDLHLTKHIQDQGVSCVKLPFYVKHKRSWSKIRNNGKWYAQGYYMVEGRGKVKEHLLKTALSFGKYALTFPLHWRLSTYTMIQNFHIFNAMLELLLDRN